MEILIELVHEVADENATNVLNSEVQQAFVNFRCILGIYIPTMSHLDPENRIIKKRGGFEKTSARIRY